MRSSCPDSDLLVALNSIPDLSRSTLCRLALDLAVWSQASRRQLPERAAELGVPVRALLRAREALATAPAVADRERRAAAALGAHLVTAACPAYPAVLRDLPLPPPALYCRGELPAGPAVAIVGSRRPGEYGREHAWWFARELAQQGAVVVSGFARGVDGAAHRGALDGGGRTVAVLGCGLDVPYPRRNHAELAAPIAGSGALLSELPVGTRPRPESFPQRNRLIAALAQATLVVEATLRSGSLITAHHALELGREVFALPGRICDETAQGCNALIADGARPALHPRDLASELGLALPAAVTATPPLPGLAGRLWLELPQGASRGADELASRCGAAMDETLAALLELELGGWVARRPGPSYCRRG
jgi:DNA processing protein